MKQIQKRSFSDQEENRIDPGFYQFRPVIYAPWFRVRVFRESPVKKHNLRVRLAGIEMDADKLINRGEWKPG